MEIKLKNLQNCEAAKKALYKCNVKGGSYTHQKCYEEQGLKAHVNADYDLEIGGKKGEIENVFRYIDKDNVFYLRNFHLKCIDEHTAELVSNGVGEVIYRHPAVEIRKTVDSTGEDPKKFTVVLFDPQVSELLLEHRLEHSNGTDWKSMIFKMENGTKAEWQKIGGCKEVNAEDQIQKHKGGKLLS